MFYRAFGLDIASEVTLSGVVSGCPSRVPDVTIRNVPTPQARERTLFFQTPQRVVNEDSILRVFSLPCGSFQFAYSDGCEFHINASGSEVWMYWPDHFTPEDAVTYLLGPILGFLLRLRGVVSLHASGVMIDDLAIALVGEAGAGKSTTAAAFAQLGHPVITDDVFALAECEGRFFVEPGYATVRLWPDSVASLCGAPDALPLITPNWDKRYLDLRSGEFRFAGQRVPIAAIYVLKERSFNEGAPAVTREPDPFLALLSNTYCSYLLDRPARAHEFDVLSRLVNSTVVRGVTPHADPSRLPELCALIADDVRSHTLATAS